MRQEKSNIKFSKIRSQGFLKDKRHVDTSQWDGHDFDGMMLDEIQIQVTLNSEVSIDLLIDQLKIMRACFHRPSENTKN